MLETYFTYLQQLGVCSKQQSTCFFLQYRYPVLLVKVCLYLLSGRSYILERYIDSFVIDYVFQPIGMILQRTWKKKYLGGGQLLHWIWKHVVDDNWMYSDPKFVFALAINISNVYGCLFNFFRIFMSNCLRNCRIYSAMFSTKNLLKRSDLRIAD